MKRLLLLFLLLLNISLPAQASSLVAVVESIRIPPYDAAIDGFGQACSCTTKRFLISELGEEALLSLIEEEKPRLILAVGNEALGKVLSVTHIPIVYLMVFNPWDIVEDQENISGVSMNIPQKKQLEILITAAPDVERVGFLYNPDRNRIFAEKAKAAADELGVQLLSVAVHKSADMAQRLKEIVKEIDGFWMIPDIIVYTPETIQHLLQVSLENRFPVLSFSEKYLDMGAFLSVTFDPEDLGRQAGEMAQKILKGTSGRRVMNTEARKPVIQINKTVGKRLRIESDLDAAEMTLLEMGK